MSGIHQFVPLLHRWDAVGEHVRVLRDLLRDAGHASDVYTELPDPETVSETVPYTEYEHRAAPGDVLVYQLATRSAIAGWLRTRSEPLVVNYHSITPPAFFAPWSDGLARAQVACLADLASLAPAAALGIAVSRFDEAELVAAGCPRTEVIPVANAAGPVAEPDAAELARLAAWTAGGPLWLSVGRLAPNKAHEATMAALFVYRRDVDPTARLVIVGAPAEPHYAAALQRYRGRLGLDGAVAFRTGLSQGQLVAHYRAAAVLVALSGHEGFGVPLVEAMRAGLPVVALAAGATPETLGDAGVLLERSEPRRVAAAVADVLRTPGRSAALAGAGAAQVDRLGVDDAPRRLVETLERVAEAASGGPPPTH